MEILTMKNSKSQQEIVERIQGIIEGGLNMLAIIQHQGTLIRDLTERIEKLESRLTVKKADQWIRPKDMIYSDQHHWDYVDPQSYE
jgi:hypothetical protein